MDIPRITIVSPNRERWHCRRDRPALDQIVNFVGTRTLRRLKNKLPFSRNFGSAVELVPIWFLRDAAAILSTGRDIRKGDAGRQLLQLAHDRIERANGIVGSELKAAAPAIRKAIIAAVFAWLRVQFPVLNAGSAVAAAGLLQSLLENRKGA